MYTNCSFILACELNLNVDQTSISPVVSIWQVLRGTSTLAEAGVQDGDTVTAVVRQAMLVSNIRSLSFALMKNDGSLVTWGANEHHLEPTVQQAASSVDAWAAVRDTGEVVTWGDPEESDARRAPGCRSYEINTS